jgi:hypothetical protein
MPASSMAPMQNASRPRGHPKGRLVEIGGSRRLEQAACWFQIHCKREGTCLWKGYKMITVHSIVLLCWMCLPLRVNGMWLLGQKERQRELKIES